MLDSWKTTMIGGVFALLGAVGGATITGWSQVRLAEHKFNSDLVLKALESEDPNNRLASLTLLVETNLIKDSEIKEGVKKYKENNKENPSSIPQHLSKSEFSPPLTNNARIYLLAGSKDKQNLLSNYKYELVAIGYSVLGQRHLVDPGRPGHEEIRYFYSSDKDQAEKIAEDVSRKLSKPAISVKLFSDNGARPGYIEIWLGR